MWFAIIHGTVWCAVLSEMSHLKRVCRTEQVFCHIRCVCVCVCVCVCHIGVGLSTRVTGSSLKFYSMCVLLETNTVLITYAHLVLHKLQFQSLGTSVL